MRASCFFFLRRDFNAQEKGFHGTRILDLGSCRVFLFEHTLYRILGVPRRFPGFLLEAPAPEEGAAEE